MSASLTVLLAAALLAEPAAGERLDAPPAGQVVLAAVGPLDQVAAAAPDALDAMMLGALPDPPKIVVRQTRYFGQVTVDHRAHLARRAACKSCHGSGPITKLTFTPRIAHERCIGCHQQQAKGPSKCNGCHVREPPPPPVLVAAATGAAAAPKVPAANPANLAAAMAAFDAPVQQPLGLTTRVREPFQRVVEVGLAAGTGQGVGARLVSRQDGLLLTQSIERLVGSSASRTVGLLGAGLVRPIRPRLALQALAVGGVDVVDRPVTALLPALGVRAGAEWRTQWRFCPQLSGSLTTLFDLTRSHGEYGDHVGGVQVYLTVSTGFRVP